MAIVIFHLAPFFSPLIATNELSAVLTLWAIADLSFDGAFDFIFAY